MIPRRACGFCAHWNRWALVREGVYLLPDTPENRKALDALAVELGEAAGSAHVLRVVPASSAQEAAFRRLFDRTTRYAELVKTIESLRIGFGHSDPSAIARVLHKQRRDFEAIAALDFFPSAPRSRAREASCYSRPSGSRCSARTSRSSAVSGRRFIDPESRLGWLEEADALPSEAIGFAFDGAPLAMSGERVVYEELLARLSLANNPALARIGSIVHFLEVGGAPVAEAAGVHTLLQGAVRRSQNDAELFAEAEKTFDLLYEAYYEPAKR